MPFRPCFDHKRIKLREIYSTQKEHMFAKIPSRGVKFRFRFSPPFLLPQKWSRRKEFSFLLISFLLLSQEEKTKRKTFPPFLFLFSIFSRSGRNGSILDFSPLSSLSFQKKRRRKGVGEEVFSLSFLSFFFLSLFFFRRKRREEELLFPSLFLPLGEEFFSHSFSFFLSFFRRKGERKNSFFSSLLGERKMGEKEGEKRKE